MSDRNVSIGLVGTDRVSPALHSAARSAQHAESGFKRFGETLRHVAGIAGLAIGLHESVEGLKKLVEAGREANKTAALTEAVLKSTGGAAGVTAAGVDRLAKSISESTGIEDDLIKANENLLLTFTGVHNAAGKGNKIFDRATLAVQNMSVALGKDSKSSAIALGKALQDPVRGATALRRVGVALTQQQQDQIKKFVESGHVMDAQKVILRELGTEFGGAAVAAATPMDKLRATLHVVAEEVGQRMIPVIDRVAGALGRFVKGMQDGEGGGGRFAGFLRGIVDGMKRLWATFADSGGVAAVQSIFVSIGVILSSLKGKGDDAAGGMSALQTAVGALTGALQLGAKLMAFLAEHTTALKVVVLALAIELGGPVTQLAALAAALTWAYQKSTVFRDIVVTMAEVVIRGFSGILKGIELVLEGLGHIPGFGWAATAADKVQGLVDKLNGTADALANIRDQSPVVVEVVQKFVGPVAGGRWDPNFIGPVGPDGGPKIGEKRPHVASADQNREAGARASAALATGIASGAAKASAAAQKVADAAKAKFDDLKAAAKQLSDSVRDSVAGWFTLKDKGNPFAGMGSIAAKITRFAHAINKLISQHVAPALVQMIAQAGPDAGYRAALELSTGGKANRALVGAKFNQISNAAASIGAAVSGDANGPALGVAKSQLDVQRGILRALTKSSKNPHHAAGFAAP